MVERQLPKLHTRVRFPSPAPSDGFRPYQNKSKPARFPSVAGFSLRQMVSLLTIKFMAVLMVGGYSENTVKAS